MASFTAGGAYDQAGVSAAVAARHPDAAIIVPPRSTAVPSEVTETAPTQRDRHLGSVAEHGRAAWQKASGYTTRAQAEAGITRFKQVIGDGLRSRTDRRRATEVGVAVHALNRMPELGRPSYVRIAMGAGKESLRATRLPSAHIFRPRRGHVHLEVRTFSSRCACDRRRDLSANISRSRRRPPHSTPTLNAADWPVRRA